MNMRPGHDLSSLKHFARAVLSALFVAAALLHAPELGAEQTIRFGINPWGSEQEMHKIFRPLMDYLSERLGVKIDIVIPESYEALSKRVGNGEIDLASYNSVTLLKAMHSGQQVRYLVTTTTKDEATGENKPYYDGYIIVRADSKYNSLDDLKGKKFAFVDTDSASGYKMPVAYLAIEKHSSPKDFFKKFFLTGNHDRVIAAVYNRSVDGGATWDNGFAINKKKFPKGSFRIIETIPNIPNDAWVTGPNVKPEIAERIKSVLLSIDTSTRTSDGRLVIDTKAGFPGTGWSEKSTDFYEAMAKYLLYKGK